MKEYINELVEIGMGSTIDISMDKVVMEDELHKQYMKEAKKLQDQFDEIGLSEEQQNLIAEYLEMVETANVRACNLTYLMGIKKTFAMIEEYDILEK